MSESRKNRLSIDGGQVKEDENVASYKPIPDADAEFRTKPTLSKSREKVSDEAEEKLLDKEEEAKIVTRVDMADAKYVVGDHRNGDAKIELDANARQFSGLSKEELLKYADDPFWVRLRWFMFTLFWALWLCMLAGAIGIIIRAPKCAPPQPKTWFEKGPLVDTSSLDSYEELEQKLPLLRDSQVQGIFTDVPPTYEVLDDPDLLTQFKNFAAKAKEAGIKVIVDLTPNYVPATHRWFQYSVNGTAPYDTYFNWARGGDYVDGAQPKPPNNWVSTMNTSAWQWNGERKQFYLRQFDAEHPDLDFHNPAVVQEFDGVIKAYMSAGADGIRLHKVRQILVNKTLPDEPAAAGRGSSPAADHLSYAYYNHRHTADQPGLDALLAHWAALVGDPDNKVFTIAEEGVRAELFLLERNVTSLRPRAAALLHVGEGTDLKALVGDINKRLRNWPAIQMTADGEGDTELAEWALLLPAAPVLDLSQLEPVANDTLPNERLSHLVALRSDASVEHGRYVVAAAPADNSTRLLLACARWKAGHTGYVAVYNPAGEEVRADLSLPSVPAELTVHHMSHRVRLYTNYTSAPVHRDDILVPPRSTLVLSYVPVTAEME